MANVIITDFQAKKQYRGTVTAPFEKGKSAKIKLSGKDHPKVLQITSVRGWVMSDSLRNMYIFDTGGRKFKVSVI